MNEPQVVTVRGLRKSYGTRMVVDGLDLGVPAGEIVGLIGANGAGKTTTVECIQGLRKPDDGRLRVLGFDPDSVTVPPLQRMSFRSVVTLPREQLRIFEVEGRSLFVPLVGFNALYRWSSGSGQTSATFIVGRNTEGEKIGCSSSIRAQRRSADLQRANTRSASATNDQSRSSSVTAVAFRSPSTLSAPGPRNTK